MSPKSRARVAEVLSLAVITASNFGCGGSTPPPPPPVMSVSLSQTSAAVQPQATSQFTATVNNDPSGKGVTWSITSCNGQFCGSVSPTATASGTPTSYTAPQPPGVTLMVNLTATAVADPTKSEFVAITVPAPTKVSVSPGLATVPGTAQFTAIVGNDPANAGVTWQMFAALFCNGLSPFSGCQQRGVPPVISLPCSGCGTVSPASTASGAAMTYTAPARVVPPTKTGYFFCGFCAATVGAVATSVTYTASSASAGLTLPPISVSVSPGSVSVPLNDAQQFTATVQNDGTNSGVNWTLTENGVVCSPACGTMSPAKTAGGVASGFQAPAIAPTSPLVRVIATSVEDSTKSAGLTFPLTLGSGAAACNAGSGNEFLLKGQYAFMVNSAVGSFTADGTGRITAGEEDVLRPMLFNTDTTLSSYAVGPDGRGCLVLSGAKGLFPLAFSFSLGSVNAGGVATAGHLAEIPEQVSGPFQNTLPSPTGTGMIRLQDPTSFTASHFKGNYVFGFTCCARVAIVGTLTADGISTISSSTLDTNDLGTVTNLSSAVPQSITCCDAYGRGGFNTPIGNLPDIAFYMINGSAAFLIADDNNTDLFQGAAEIIAIPAGTNFTQASLNGNAVLRETAQSSTGPVVDVALAAADGNGAMTVDDNVNSVGTFSSSSTAFSYTVASNGRVTLTGGATPPLLYLNGQNRGFLLGTDANVTFGIIEPQAAGPFNDASFSGNYMLGTENPTAGTVAMQSGVLTADGKGNATGIADESIPSALPQSNSLNLTYSFPANGVGDIGSGTTAILISGSKLVFISNTNANPTITVVEK